MRTVRTIAALREALQPLRGAKATVGLVPTMGAFHEGHLSLMRRARSECDVVVVSLFVNPSQFNDPQDLEAYPRDDHRDTALAAEAGIDFLFVPDRGELYPSGFGTSVSVSGVSEVLEGAHRGAGHFTGVATIVLKLLNIVSPDFAYFGQKDAQQIAVIKQLVRDLDVPVEIRICPTVRAPDGLALSSRNAQLSVTDRERATALYRSLRAAEQATFSGERASATVFALAAHELSDSAIELEYFELVQPDTFAPLEQLEGEVLVLIAASIGGIRLIDNHSIQVPAAVADAREPSGDADPAPLVAGTSA